MDKEIEDLAVRILEERVLEIRDIGVGEKPFLYSSGNYGPGYAMVKGTVGKKPLLKKLISALARKVAFCGPKIGFIAANATGGMVPGWILSEDLGTHSKYDGKQLPYVYVRGTRKKGGHGELITGIENNPLIKKGYNALVVEELVNFAETTCNSAEELRLAGYEVTHAACILFYDNPVAKARLAATNLELISVLTLPEILEVAEKRQTHPAHVIADYREFLKDPAAWMTKHSLKKNEEGGTM